MRHLPGVIALLMSFALLSSCAPVDAVQATPAPVVKKNAATYNAAVPNLAALTARFKSANRRPISVVQLGDSHTAADLFSGEMRRLLQAQYGDGGIGFVAATPVPGTRYERVILTTAKRQWALVSARNQQSAQFPLGGYLALPQVAGAQVRIAERQPSGQRYRVSALYQAQANNSLKARDGATQASRMLAATGGQWRFSPVFNNIALPVELSIAQPQGLALGGWNIQGQKNAGVTYSALGINGARLDVLDKWQAGWLDTLKALRPDLVVLAYGTNEAFDDELDLGLYERQLQGKIAELRRTLPKAVILLVGAPDSIKNRRAQACAAAQPHSLRQAIQIQKTVARQSGALYWDWQAFMGGDCSIRNWQAREMARGDLVHLTADGYRQSAEGLYRFLRGQLGERLP